MFRGVDGFEIFSAQNPQAVAKGVREAQYALQWSSNLPSYEELNKKVDGNITVQQYIEILAFIAPTKGKEAASQDAWETAVRQSAGKANKQKVDLAAQAFSNSVFVYRPETTL